MFEYKLLIAGKLVSGVSVMPVIDPATGQSFSEAPRADREQALAAIDAASAAFATWASAPQFERAECLGLLSDALERESEYFAQLLTSEQGKPIAQARLEVAGSVKTLRYYSALSLSDVTLRQTDEVTIVEQRVPLGVVVAITPWNYPLSLLITKIAPALCAGNTVVAKPAPTTPLTTLELGRLAAHIFPSGVFNVVTDLNDLGELLTGHPAVAKVSFTGSTATGRRVMASAAETVKRVTLELGGNDPAIILDDADVSDIAPKLFRAAMTNAGQVCIAVKRIYVPSALLDEVSEALGALAKSAVVGPGGDDRSTIGPLQNAAQYQRVRDLLRDAAASGTVVAGGLHEPSAGYFVQPTVVRDLPVDSPLIHEEQFGPILPLVAYDEIETVIKEVNSGSFGLGASVWSSNRERAITIASQIVAGTVWVNKHAELPIDVPFGGAKQSGLGRERGKAGLEEFSQARILNAAA